MKFMRGTPRLLETKPTEGYFVHLRFEDGTEADVDLSYLARLEGVFEPLRDPKYFRRLRIYPEGQTIFWPKCPQTREGEREASGGSERAHPGAEEALSVQADIAPESLYTRARDRSASAV